MIEAFYRAGAYKDAAAEREAIDSFLSEVPLPELFQAISTPQSTMVLAVISRIFAPPFGARFITPESTPYIAAGLSHSDNKVRTATIGIIYKLATVAAADAAAVILGNVPLSNALVAAIADENVGVSSKAADSIVGAMVNLPLRSGGEPDMAKRVLSRAAEAAQDDRYATSSSTHLMRFVDLIVRSSVVSETVFQAALDSGALELLPAIIKRDDVLLQMNAMELVGKLCTAPSHVNWLFRSGIAAWLLELVAGPDGSGEPDAFLGNDALRTLGSMLAGVGRSDDVSGGASVDATAVDDPQLVLRFLRAATRAGGGDAGGGKSLKIAAADALSTFAASSETHLDMVLGDSTLLESWLTLTTSPQHKAFVLHSLAHVIAPRRDEGISAAVAAAAAAAPPVPQPPLPAPPVMGSSAPPPPPASDPTADASREHRRQALLQAFDVHNRSARDRGAGEAGTVAGGLELAMAHARLPIEEVRIGALDLLRALASSPWGLAAFDGYAGIYAFLLNRNRDVTSKAEKEWSFHVVETLYKNPQLPSSRVSTLHAFLTQGPFYVPPRQAEMEVQ